MLDVRCLSSWNNSSITLKSVHLYTKRWYFVLHVARCVIISPFFLFSLSQSVWHRFLTSLPQSSLLFVVFCNAHMVAHHTIFLFVFFSDFLPPLLYTLSFSFLLSSLSLSVMAYQDGFYGAADLYVSIPLSPLRPHSSPTFSPSCLWVFKCEMALIKPIETCTFGCFELSYIDIFMFSWHNLKLQIN